MKQSAPTAPSSRRNVVLAVTVLLMAAGQAEAARKASKESSPTYPIPRARVAMDIPARDALVVREGFRVAYQRIKEVPACGALFGPLHFNGETALVLTSYTVPQPGPEKALCKRGVLAVARAGHKEIRLCPKFWNLAPEGMAAMLIHEAMHTAGLGEYPVNPKAPTSEQITLAVLKACDLGR